MRWLLCLALCLPGGLLLGASKDRASVSETKGWVYAEGESIRLVASRETAEMAALRDAIDRISTALERKGLGSKKDLATGVENAVLKETDLGKLNLGKARIESVYQERWVDAPDGKEAWSVKVKISVSLGKKAAKKDPKAP